MIHNETFKIRSIEASNRWTARPSVVLDIMQETAGGQLEHIGIDDVKMHEEEHKAFIISRMTLEIYGSMPPASYIDARTWFTVGKAANFPRNYEIVLDGEVKARGLCNWALVDTENKKLVRYKDYPLPEEHAEEKLELGISDRFRIPKDAEFTEVSSMKVEFWQTDINKHLNNVRYVDPMWSCLPDIENRDVKAVSIHYMHEAVRGENVRIMVSNPYPCDIEVEGEGGVIDNHYSPLTDEIVYVRMETDEETKAEAMWILTK